MARTKPSPSQPEQSGTIGTGGELHQQPTAGAALLTTNQDVVIADNQNSLKAAPRGPTLLEDSIIRKRSPILTTSAFPSELSIRADPAPTDSSSSRSR